MLTDGEIREELHNMAAQAMPSPSYVSALISLGGELSISKKGYSMLYSSADYKLAMELAAYIKHHYNYAAEIEIKQPADKRRKRYYEVLVAGKCALQLLSDLKVITLDASGRLYDCKVGFVKDMAHNFTEASDYMRAVYLGAGSTSPTESGFRLILSFDDEDYCNSIAKLLNYYKILMKCSVKGKQYNLSARAGQTISDFYAFIGAGRCVLAVQEYMVQSETQHRISRAANLDVANLDKSVSAAVSQAQAILLIKEKTGFIGLPPELREVAACRLDNPDLSLEELAKKLPSHITKSGLYHRIRKLMDIAKQLKGRELL